MALSLEAKAQLTETLRRARVLLDDTGEDEDLTLQAWRVKAALIISELALAVKNLQLEVIKLDDKLEKPRR